VFIFTFFDLVWARVFMGGPMRNRINMYEPAIGRFIPVVFSVVGVFAVV
jgi:hypothetical protein